MPVKSQIAETLYDVVVIGAGFAGAFTAAELSKRTQLSILMIDPGGDLIPPESSSYNQCYKLHTGMHYAGHLATAKQCLRDSIKFAREVPDCLLGASDSTLPWRRGRHYLMSNSLFKPDIVQSVSEALTAEYKKLVEEDENNKVFGEPENFIRVLKAEEYPYVAKSIPQPDMPCEEDIEDELSPRPVKKEAQVVLGLETPESQIDLTALRTHLRLKLEKSVQITFAARHEVVRIRFEADSLNYALKVKNKESGEIQWVRTKGVVNCAWQNIENLDRDIGYYVPDNRLIRVKVSLLVRLPESLCQMNTCIFSIGPHCSITNLGDGTAIVTYEPITNVGHYAPGPNPEFSNPILSEIIGKKLSPTEGVGADLANEIMRGAAYYVPEMSHATVEEVRVGYVKLFMDENEKFSLNKKASPIHRRVEEGVKPVGLAYIENSGMKMTYTQNNAETIRQLLQREMFLRDLVQSLIKGIKEKLYAQATPLFSSTCLSDIVLFHSFRELISSSAALQYEDPKYLTEDQMSAIISRNVRNKNQLIKSFVTLFPKVSLRPPKKHSPPSSPLQPQGPRS